MESSEFNNQPDDGKQMMPESPKPDKPHYNPARIPCEWCGELRVKGARLCGHCGTTEKAKTPVRRVHLDWESGVSAGFGFIVVLPIVLAIMAFLFLVFFGGMAGMGNAQTDKTVRDRSGHLVERWDQRSDTLTDVRGPHGHLKEIRTRRGINIYVRDGNGRLLRMDPLN